MFLALRRLRAHQWAWIHFKVVLGIGWASAMFLVPPVSIRDGLNGALLLMWTGLTTVGAVISVTGMLLSTSQIIDKERRGLLIELLGLLLLAGGPASYLAIQISFVFTGAFDARYALAWFAYAMIAAMAARAVYVGSIYFKGGAR